MTDPKGVRLAREIADDVLFPAATKVDAGDDALRTNLDLLASEGFYGMAAPPELNRLELPDFQAACQVMEALASGCLTTSFVWAQHHNAVMAAANSAQPGIREQWLEPLCTGQCRAGLAIGAAARPGPPLLRATRVDAGYVFDGEAPWVSGWGMLDVLYVAARDDQDLIIWALVDAREGDRLTARPLDMVAVQASRTVHLTLDRYFVPDERVTGTMPRHVWAQRDPATLRSHGSLCLGVTARCCALLGDGALDGQLDACRDALDAAGPEEIPAARAAAAELALRAAAMLTVSVGSRSVLLDDHAQRLVREATFLLVFGSRPGIKAGLLGRLAHTGR